MKKNGYVDHLTLLGERFPSLLLLAPQWEPKSFSPSIQWPPSWEKADLLLSYGLHEDLFFKCRDWLQQNPERQLVFLEDEPGHIASFLHRPQAKEVLSYPQVHIELFRRKKKEIEQIVTRYCHEKVEIIPLKKMNSSLRLRLLRQAALSYALRMDRRHGYHPFAHFCKNAPHLASSFYANGLKNAFSQVPAIICGAGPSLQATLPPLRTMENRALIIGGGSTLAALSSQGILPHFAMALDPNDEEYLRLKNSFTFEVPLLYSTRVHPGLFQTCNGPFGYLRSGIGGLPELWLEEELGLTDRLIGDFLSPESMSVTTICVAWAQFLGCNPILLNGIDLAYTGQRHYAEGVVEQPGVQFERLDANKESINRILRRKGRNGQWVKTAVRWVMESDSIAQFAKHHPQVRFINTTDGGLGMKGIPYLPLAEATRDFLSLDSLRHRVHKAIFASPMPALTGKIIRGKMQELKESLERCIGYLEILAQEKRGSLALAEHELREELAYDILFYDVATVFSPRSPTFWADWLSLAKNYKN